MFSILRVVTGDEREDMEKEQIDTSSDIVEEDIAEEATF